MDAVPVAEAVAGIVLAALTLHDVFYTVIVPGGSRGLFKVSRRLSGLALPVWKRFGRKGVTTNFAPLVLVASFTIWMLLLVLAFGLVLHPLADSFDPPLRGFGHALYAAGASMVTVGPGLSDPEGLAAAAVLAAGFCGLGVVTMAVTYLLQVQNHISQRDSGVIQLSTATGQPPSAVVLLERYAQLGCRGELPQVLRDGRAWCAAVYQSHMSHPSLIYFRSAGTGSGWPAALGALVDLAVICEELVDEPAAFGAAVLAREEAERLARGVCEFLELEAPGSRAGAAATGALRERLAAAGYSLREGRDPARFDLQRANRVRFVDALARHLGMPGAPLLGTRGDERSPAQEPGEAPR